MKKILLLLTLAPSLAFGQSYEVLFLGNSYTYYNNMPQQVADLASSFGDTINYDSNTPGGATFNGHSTNAATLAKIRQQDWDYVVLQAQSQEPSFSPWQVANDVYPYAQILVDSIAQNSLSTEPLFFMTWGRKYGDQQNCAAYPPICTYQGMQNRLRQSYLEMAATHNASASPVGISWQNAMALDSTIDLYSTDNSHPSIYGSYLAACTFYSSLFKKSCVGSSFWPTGIDSATAVFLQSVASSTVLDSLAVWKIFNADFTHSANGNSVVFTNSSSNYESLLWDFGDGNQSTDANPTHTYAASGSYTSTLTAYNNSNYFTDTISKVISVVSVLMTYVPDDNFEQALIDLGYDTGALDDSVPTANINTVAGLNVSSKNISDLTGIADFTWLLSLDCFSNNLDSLDLSHTNNLQHLDCSNNPLESLDISGASYLYYLYSDFCQLTTVDVTNNIYLEELDVEVNQIQNIDISQNTNMLELYFTFNQLTEIDVSHMGSLTVLQCNDNELT
jgi:PKD repeat protein